MSSETPKAELNIPEEAAPFRVSWWDGSNHVAFDSRGVRLIVAAELEAVAQHVHDRGALAMWTALDVEMLLKGRASELRGEV